MADETQPQNQAAPQTASDNLGIIERAEKATQILMETEKRLEQKKQEYETLLAKQLLSGRATAGTENKSPEVLRQEAVETEIKKRMANFY